MKVLDIIAAILLIIGGLNWGLVGFFNLDLIGSIFGQMSGFSRLIYCVIGISALYQIFQWKAMHSRWKRK